jgi:CorA-like Mg2+ transporter protein
VGEKFYMGCGQNRKACTLQNKLYRGGYIDFSRRAKSAPKIITGPKRGSALEDLVYYYTHSQLTHEIDYTSPLAVTTVLKRYVASHWMILAQYGLDLMYKYEYTYHRAENFASLSTSLIQNSLLDVQHLNDRIANWCEFVNVSINQFKATGTLGNFPGQSMNEIEQEDDFIQILRQLKDLKQRVQTVISSMAGVISIVEAMRMKELSFFAMVFIPLGLTSGIFSMAGKFAPGQSGFWVYWVVGLSLVCLVFVVAFWLSPGISFARSLLVKRMRLSSSKIQNAPKMNHKLSV